MTKICSGVNERSCKEWSAYYDTRDGIQCSCMLIIGHPGGHECCCGFTWNDNGPQTPNPKPIGAEMFMHQRARLRPLTPQTTNTPPEIVYLVRAWPLAGGTQCSWQVFTNKMKAYEETVRLNKSEDWVAETIGPIPLPEQHELIT